MHLPPFKTRIYIEDTDCADIVYHTNYLKYMERARSNILMDLGWTLEKSKKEDVIFAVRSAGIDFLKPATLFNELIITTEIKQMKTSSIECYHEIAINSQNPILAVTGTIWIVCINHNGKPRAIPYDIKEAFSQSKSTT